MKKDTQHNLLINHFTTKGEPLTVATALSLYGVYALSQRCGELRKQGFNIKDEWVTLANGKRIKQYSL